MDDGIFGCHPRDEVVCPGGVGHRSKHRTAETNLGLVISVSDHERRKSFDSDEQVVDGAQGLHVGVEVDAAESVDQIVAPDVRALGKMAGGSEQLRVATCQLEAVRCDLIISTVAPKS